MSSKAAYSNHPLHLEIQTHRKNPIGLLRSSFRVNGSTKHKTFARITGKTLQQLKILQAAFKGQAVPLDSHECLRTSHSREFGASNALLELADNIGLTKIIYSKKEPWVRCVLAMVIGRILFQGSKLALIHRKSTSCLWSVVGIDEDELDVHKHCYEVMDRLLQRHSSIQKSLVKKHLKSGSIILYDITSSYFEGQYDESEIVFYGHNRDKKSGRKQIVVGLICNEQGCPVCVEVFSGNTKDESTVQDKVKQLQNFYGIERFTFVGDRGMLTQTNQEKLKDTDGLDMISALTHPQIFELIQDKVIEPELFDDHNIAEIADPKISGRRLFLCRNPQSAQREANTRESLMNSLQQRLESIADGATKKTATVEQIAMRVGRAFEKYKIGKLVQWSIVDVKVGKHAKQGKGLCWSWNENRIAAERLIDGCYVISSTVPQSKMNAQESVSVYKGLSAVEQAFRNFKTVSLEMRPICHKLDERIRAHVFICMLAYYLQWHMTRRLSPLFKTDGKHEQRQWTLRHVIETLQSIGRRKAQLNGIEFEQTDTPNAQQQWILELMKSPR